MRRRFSGIYYGWWIVAASFVMALYAGGGIFYGFTAIFEPIADELGWSYAQISLAASLRGLEMGLFAPIVGILIDRWGPRRLVFGGVLTASVGLFLLSRADSLGTFYGAFVLLSLGVSASTMTTVVSAVANWFRRRVGIATGIAICGFGFAGFMVPILVKLVDAYNWRVAVALLATGMLLVPLPLSLLFRHRPEQYGYRVDGDASDPMETIQEDISAGSPAAGEAEVTARQALKSRTFWVLALAFSSQVLLVTSAITHVMPYLSSIGVARPTASLVASAVPVVSIAGRLGFGWFGDHFSRRWIAAAGFGMMALGMLFFGLSATVGRWGLVPFIILFGIGYGGVNVMRAALAREYFGRRSFGTVFGMIMGISMAGSVAGPALAGWAYDTWGSYQVAWLLYAAVPVAALIATLNTSPIRKPGQSVTG